MAGAIELAGRERVDPVLPGKQPALRPRLLPPGAQQRKQVRGEHHVAILAPLALLDPDDHAGAVDVGDLERDDLRGAQARPVGHAQRRPVLEARRRLQQARDLLGAQHDRQPPGLPDERHVDHDIGLAQRHHEEKPQRRQAVIDGWHARAARGQVQPIAAHVLGARLVRRSAKESAEVLDGADVAFLRPRRELADRHIFDHAPT